MFAPVGYTPLSMLWDQFLDAKLESVYRSASTYYASERFDSAKIRGSPLDIAEHIFTGLMWKCWPHAASASGDILRIHSRYQDGVPGLFALISPYHSALEVARAEIEGYDGTELDIVAGEAFEAWDFEPDEGLRWRETYPTIPDSIDRLSGSNFERLRFHTLPVCFERSRFVIVRELPHWGRFFQHGRDQEVLVEHLGGRALCVPDNALKGWTEILSGQTPILEDELSMNDAHVSRPGRPPKVPKVIEAYERLFPDGHLGSLKEAIARIEVEISESVSEPTIRRAITAIQRRQTEAEE